MNDYSETTNFTDDGTSFAFSGENHFEFGGKGKARREARQENRAVRKDARVERKVAKKEAKAQVKLAKAEVKKAGGGAGAGIGAGIGAAVGGIGAALLPSLMGGGAAAEAAPTYTEGPVAGGSSAPAGTSTTIDSYGNEVDAATGARVASTDPATSAGGMSKNMKMGLIIGGAVVVIGIVAFVVMRNKA